MKFFPFLPKKLGNGYYYIDEKGENQRKQWKDGINKAVTARNLRDD